LSVVFDDHKEFEYSIPIVVVGAGGCGLSAALSAKENNSEVLVIERDSTPLGTTAMSTGLIPGANTRLQRAAGIEDTPEIFANDIIKKTKGETDPEIATSLAIESSKTIEWLIDKYQIPLSLVDSFLYPGHTVMRMHGTPNRTGSELMGALCRAAERAGIDVLTNALVTDLYSDSNNKILGVKVLRTDGQTEEIGCDALILACCGFAGNPEMVEEYMPEIKEAEFFGHPGNKGDAIKWGKSLGADLADIGSYQGHGGLAAGRGVPILWPMIMEGGFQININGERFSDESLGYSEQAVKVVSQPKKIAWNIFDERLHELMKEFEDYNNAIEANAIINADSTAELSALTGINKESLDKTIKEVEEMVEGKRKDSFGRDFTIKPKLESPYYTVKVTGALFHTQGGLVVNEHAQVMDKNKDPLPNLFAGGGSARGISGPSDWGYIAGNGLLTATTFGRLAGVSAANLVKTDK
jgi:fumarate reductase flavoprotein subunit|tara:strand:+ start:1471 stop:2874 length:1404 start_codon:yes stop_codon:yes gene_type:complete